MMTLIKVVVRALSLSVWLGWRISCCKCTYINTHLLSVIIYLMSTLLSTQLRHSYTIRTHTSSHSTNSTTACTTTTINQYIFVSTLFTTSCVSLCICDYNGLSDELLCTCESCAVIEYQCYIYQLSTTVHRTDHYHIITTSFILIHSSIITHHCAGAWHRGQSVHTGELSTRTKSQNV